MRGKYLFGNVVERVRIRWQIDECLGPAVAMATVVGQPAASGALRATHTASGAPQATNGRLLLAAAPIAGAIVLGMLWDIQSLTAIAAIAALLSAVVSPPVGLILLAFMGPLKSPDVIPPPGFNFALLGAILMGCIYRLPIDRPRVRLTAPALLLLAFLLYAFVQQSPEMIAVYLGDEPHRLGGRLIQLAACAGTAIAAGYVVSQQRPYVFLAAGLGAACVASLLTISENYGGVASSPLADVLTQTDNGIRAVGSFGNPNYFGQFLATAIATAVGWSLLTTQRMLRWLLLGVAVLAGAALALSLSRGAIGALLAGMACLAMLRSRPLGAAFVVLGLVGAVVVYPAFVEWRLGSATGAAYSALNASDAYRLSAVLAGPQLFLSSPLFGVGFGQYSVLSAQFTAGHFAIESHNWYINVLAEQGLVGAVLWALLLVSVVLRLRVRPAPARLVGFGVLAVYTAGSLSTTQPTDLQTSVLPLIVISAALVGDWSQATSIGPLRPDPHGEIDQSLL